MARPERHDADYFPFYAKNGRTLFILQDHYGLAGIGFFTNLMRLLTTTPDHHISIADEADRLYVFSQIGCTEEEGSAMLELMCKTGKIDRGLYETKQVIFSKDLLESLSDAYRKRLNSPITAEEIHLLYGFPAEETQLKAEETHKGKERKGKDTKRFVPPNEEEVKEYCKERKNKVNASLFIDHYEANGWKVGKNSMKDWKAAIRTWEKNDFNKKNKDEDEELILLKGNGYRDG